MKKRNGILALVVSIGFFSSTSLTSMDKMFRPVSAEVSATSFIAIILGLVGLLPEMPAGGSDVNKVMKLAFGDKVSTYVGIAGSMVLVYDLISTYVAKNKEANEALLRKAVDYASDRNKLMLSEFPEKIEDRIDVLLNQKLQDGDKSIPIFFTPQSRIFVLQNIEDFFVLRKQSESYRNLSQFVHKACMEKINAIQLAETRMDENAKIAALEIDDARKQYMHQYDISVVTLKDISFEDLQRKIEGIQREINSLVLDAINNNKIFDKEKNAKFLALISILVHLVYKQSQDKTPMFEGEERISKLKQTRVGKKDLGYNQEDFTEEGQQRAAQEKREALAKQYVGMKFLSKQEGIEKRQEEVEEYNQLKQKQPVQQSLWSSFTSRVKSWFGW